MDRAHRCATQLEALLAVTYGDLSGSFMNMADEYKDGYLWACADLATNIKEALEEINDAQRKALTKAN